MLRRTLSLAVMPPSNARPKRHHHHHHQNQIPSPISGVICSPCRHSPAATLDFLIFLLVLFSCAFLIASSLAHLFRSLPLLLPPLFSALQHSALPLPFVLLPLLAASFAFAFASRGPTPLLRRRSRCGNPRCRGLREAAEFDVQLQTGDSLRSPPAAAAAATDMWKEIDELPWKGGQQGNNPDYECLRAELRRMAPPNGRAVLLFRARCGCPVAKLAAWGPKHGRRHKNTDYFPYASLVVHSTFAFLRVEGVTSSKMSLCPRV